MVNLTDVLISGGDGEDRGDRREVAPAGACALQQLRLQARGFLGRV